uniref:Uncharacterized protein n=1 Tax=Sipha flava TaxID=143950 RepID=A0A2S2R0D8_9HEMI
MCTKNIPNIVRSVICFKVSNKFTLDVDSFVMFKIRLNYSYYKEKTPWYTKNKNSTQISKYAKICNVKFRIYLIGFPNKVYSSYTGISRTFKKCMQMLEIIITDYELSLKSV